MITSNNMSEIEYLYGVTQSTWRELKYIEAIEEKIRLSQLLLCELVDVDTKHRDFVRINEVNRSIRFNIKLLVEV